jgi:hypothetical protein
MSASTIVLRAIMRCGLLFGVPTCRVGGTGLRLKELPNAITENVVVLTA